MKTVYDEKGNSFTVDPVDAREYVETGRFFVERPVPKSAEETKSAPKPATKPEPEAKKEAKAPIKKPATKRAKHGTQG